MQPIYLNQNQQPPQQQQGGGISPYQAYNMYQGFYGGGSTGGTGGTSLFSTMGPYAAIGAAIIGQQIMAQNTNRMFEGQRTGGVTSGNFTTEPWLAFTADRLGWDFTPGEKFDAAVQNRDWDTAFARAPAAIDYWTDPARGALYTGLSGMFGNTMAGIIDPLSYGLRNIDKIF